MSSLVVSSRLTAACAGAASWVCRCAACCPIAFALLACLTPRVWQTLAYFAHSDPYEVNRLSDSFDSLPEHGFEDWRLAILEFWY